MVLQNKYKARASRRYRAAKGIPPKNAKDAKDTESEEQQLPSNTWRYTLPESEEEDDEESEPEVDLSSLHAKVAALDLGASSQAQAPPKEFEFEPQTTVTKHHEVLDAVDWDELRREKESTEAMRATKARIEHAQNIRPTAAAWRRRAQSAMTDETKPASPSPAPGPTVRYVPRSTQHTEAQDIDEFIQSIDNALPKSKASQTKGQVPVEKSKAATAPNPWQDKLDQILG